MDLIRIVNITAGIWGSFFCLLLTVGTLVIPINRVTKIQYAAFFGVGTIYQLGETLVLFCNGRPEHSMYYCCLLGGVFAYTASFLFQSCAVGNILVNAKKSGCDVKKEVYYMHIVAFGAVLTSLVNLVYPLFFRITEDNRYMITGTEWISAVFAGALIALNIYAYVRYREDLDRWNRSINFYYILIQLLFVLVNQNHTEIAYADILITVALVGFSFAVMIHAFYTIADQNRHIRQQEQELADQRTKIVLSQIQPHFMFNVLNTIYFLCGKDTAKAKVAIRDFSKYLRTNLDTLSLKEMIPFAKELEHVETYLQLEKMRFEDRLTIYYDVDTVNFRIPAITLQPMVENAVKHGLCNQIEGGSVMISVRETEKDIEIDIVDNGVGFDPAAEERGQEKTHIGINNVRKRLKSFADGELILTSSPGVGTTAHIRLPKENVVG